MKKISKIIEKIKKKFEELFLFKLKKKGRSQHLYPI